MNFSDLKPEQVLGVDISKYNVKWRDEKLTSVIDVWDYDRAIRKSAFVVQRASYGTPYVIRKDEGFDFLYPNVMKAEITGAYHYYSSYHHYLKQYDFFMKVVDKKNFDFYVVDYEKIYNVLDGRTFAEVIEFVRKIRKETGKKCLLYLNKDVYNTKMKPYGADKIINDFDLWIAQYPWAITLNLNNWPAITGINKDSIKCWQFSGGDIATSPKWGKEFGTFTGQNGIDINIWNGSISDLRNWVGKTSEPEIPTEEPPIVVEPPVNENYSSGYYYVLPKHSGYETLGVIPAIRQLYPQPKLGTQTELLLDGATLNTDGSVKSRFGSVDWWFKLNDSSKSIFERNERRDDCATAGYNNKGKLIWIPLLYSGNLIKVNRFVTGVDGKQWAEITHGFDPNNLPSIEDVKRDYLYYHLNQVDTKDKMSLISGTNFYLKLVTFGKLWYTPVEYIEEVILPKTVAVNTGLNIRSQPSITGSIVGGLSKNASVKICELYKGNYGIWGRIDVDKWIALRYKDNAPYTNWIV